MFGRDGYDRGALVALIAALIAIVLVAYFTQPSSGEVISRDTSAVQENSRLNITQSTIGSDDFSFWQDTIPQWVMATFTIFATGISWLAVVYVRDTLRETRKAVSAAEASVSEARRIGEAQTRSYLNITKANFIANPETLDVFLYIKNSGPTPAIHLAAACSLMTYEDWNGSDPWEHVPCLIDFGVAQVVGANDVEVLGFKCRTDGSVNDRFERVVARYPKCIVMVDITWTDVFRKKQMSRFILNALPANGIANTPRPYRGSFKVQYVLTWDRQQVENWDQSLH